MICYECLIVTYGLTLLLYGDTILRTLRDLDVDLSRSLKVKCDGAIGLPIYDFLLINVVNACLSLTV